MIERFAIYIGIGFMTWIGPVLLSINIAGVSYARATQPVQPRLIADQGKAGLLKIGMSLASLELILHNKVQLHPAGTNQFGAMLEVGDLPQLGISTIFGVSVEGVDVYFVENSRRQLIIEMFALALPCSDLGLLETQFERQTAERIKTPAGLEYRVLKNGKFAFVLQSKPSCNAWIRPV